MNKKGFTLIELIATIVYNGFNTYYGNALNNGFSK